MADLVNSSNSKFSRLKNKIKNFSSGFYSRVAGKFGRVEKSKNGSYQQTEFDKKLVYSFSQQRIPSLRQIKYLKRFLSRREIWLMRGCFTVIIFSLVFLGVNFYLTHLKPVPLEGGEYIEGLIGAPKRINPLYASFNDADADLSQLVFSSFFKRDINGKLAEDLVENYSLSEDDKVYTFKIKEDVRWHNGQSLTVDDVLFTFNAIKDGQYKSPLRGSFSGVAAEKVDASTIRFILRESYAAFLELFTFGILPQELWYQVPPEAATLAELNLKPVGSGPYKFKSLVKDKNGSVKLYSLTVNEDYYGKKANIKDLKFKFFVNFEEAISALNEGSIDGISYLPKQYRSNLVAQDSLNNYQLELPQVLAIFLNQKSNPVLAEKKVRQALALAIDRKEIVEQILGGEARLIDSPILPESSFYFAGAKKYNYDQAQAAKLLDEAGWTVKEVTTEEIAEAEKNKTDKKEKVREEALAKLAAGAGRWRTKDKKFLIIKLTSVDTGENTQIAEAIKNFWQRLNLKVETELVPPSQAQSDVIKPRNFQALFYGEMLGIDPDVYAFWHSSQSGQAGLNIADYSNKEADKLLEDGRLTADPAKRRSYYQKFQEILTEDEPAIFLYSPFYNYIQGKKIKGFDTKSILSPSDRFANISDWYIKTGKKLIW